jgi:mono/diheme cytochrome c family protein
MRARYLGVAVAALLVGEALACATARTSPPPASLQARVESGRHAYRTKCASCHGLDATGAGYRAGGLTPRPGDLTRIVERKGVFDPDDVAAHIDGRAAVEQHGPRSMPVWGETGVLTEPQVREVVDYLATLQREQTEKPRP